MKKLFLFIVAALMSVAAFAGANDLLWDFTETAPGSNPIAASNNPNVKLTYDSKVNDATGTNLGLKGIKMNSSGYAYFTKAAVAGKLRLTYGSRKAGGKVALVVSTWTGETAKAETAIATMGYHTDCTAEEIELTAEQNNIYISRTTDSGEGVLQKIEFKETVARTFENFTIEFRVNPFKVFTADCALPEGCDELPAGVTVEGTKYNGGQHGVQGGTIVVPVDGMVKFTFGACQYSKHDITIKKDGVELEKISNVAACGETAGNFKQFVTWIYTGDAAVLTFELGSQTYLPYLIAEATEVTPCTITFKDQNGGILGKVETVEGANLEAIPFTEEDLPSFPDAMAFRGWFYSNDKKAKIGDPISGNTTIQAKVTPIEYATVGSVQTYDLTQETFYPEDHETIEITGGSYYNDHGWYFAADGSIQVRVAGNAIVVVKLCRYSETGDVIVKAGENELAKFGIVKNEMADGAELTAKYKGEEGWLTISWTAKQYIHKVVVYNVIDFLEKDENTGYYIVPANDAASFLMALTQAQEGDKIFLPNGTYDLGEKVLTAVSKNNISIIGQSMEQTIIKNAPPVTQESINNTATLHIVKNVNGTYLQDLTLQNALDYYKNNDGRAVCLWDQGTKTVCKNVRLLSYQDTYYSNLQGAVKYFEDCEIHGTVDFICGDGSVYFKNNLLYAEKRKKDGGGNDALTANNGIATDRGYVFEGCTLKSECPAVSFGRAWNNAPHTTFLNTLVDYSAGEFGFTTSDNKVQRWTKDLMNANAWPTFGEFNTHLADGTVLTPASNIVEFNDPKSGNAKQQLETVLSAEQAAAFTMEYTLGDWTATAQQEATQAVCEEQWDNLEPDAIYMAETEGEFVMLLKGSEVMDKLSLYDGKVYTLRKANARGGFGLKAGSTPEDVENTEVSNSQAKKIFRNGQVVIVRDNKEYNVLGTQL